MVRAREPGRQRALCDALDAQLVHGLLRRRLAVEEVQLVAHQAVRNGLVVAPPGFKRGARCKVHTRTAGACAPLGAGPAPPGPPHAARVGSSGHTARPHRSLPLGPERRGGSPRERVQQARRSGGQAARVVGAAALPRRRAPHCSNGRLRLSSGHRDFSPSTLHT